MATGLQFITSFQITSSQETTDLDNIFTTEYDVYKIVFTGFATVGTSDENINIRVIDDSGTLDSDNLSNMKGAFDYLKTRFDSVFIISHLDTIKDFMDYLLPINKTDKHSNVTYI